MKEINNKSRTKADRRAQPRTDSPQEFQRDKGPEKEKKEKKEISEIKDEKKGKRLKTYIFPIGIFLMLFVMQSLLATAASFGYFIYAGKKRIADIEKYTKNYSITMAEAFARVAEFSHRTKKYKRLNTLFREKIQEHTIDEAFFVLIDGKLVLHSDKAVQKRLNGNIANDEFAYNIDWIMRPIRRKSREVQFSHYNIMSKNLPVFPIPFGSKRGHRRFIKQHLYKDINKLGWLLSKAVYVRNKPVGTVNFIISKDRIYTFLVEHITESKKIFLFAIGGVFQLSLLVSIVVLIRYRGIQKRAVRATEERMKSRHPVTRKPASVRPAPERPAPGVIEAPGIMKDDVLETKEVKEVEEEYIIIDLQDEGEAGILPAHLREIEETQMEEDIWEEIPAAQIARVEESPAIEAEIEAEMIPETIITLYDEEDIKEDREEASWAKNRAIMDAIPVEEE
ncbi:MAG: hypothetical protein GY754_40200 [bacterium]|nr:hypothetical protein [bacterium]